jgi:hypothetical protein
MTTPLTAEQRAELRRLSAKAFKAPWTYTRFEVECGGDELGDINGDDAHDCIEVEAPEEYPDGQCVCQQTIAVPGLEMFAEPNGQLIAAMRNALVPLLDAADRAEELSERCAVLECAMRLEVGEKRFAHLKAVLDSDTPRSRRRSGHRREPRKALEARVKLLEGLLGEAASYVEEYACGKPHDLLDQIRAALPRPQPSDERRDEQGEPEQLVGAGDGSKDRDDG